MHFTNENSYFRSTILFFQNFDLKFEISEFKTINLPIPTKVVFFTDKGAR